MHGWVDSLALFGCNLYSQTMKRVLCVEIAFQNVLLSDKRMRRDISFRVALNNLVCCKIFQFLIKRSSFRLGDLSKNGVQDTLRGSAAVVAALYVRIKKAKAHFNETSSA